MLQVTCQDEDSTQCMPKTAFLALLRHPEVSSSLAAYSRAARVTQDTKSRNDMAHLRALTEEGDDTEICVPGRVYLQLLKKLGWKRVASLTEDGQKYTEYISYMQDLFRDNGIVFVANAKFPREREPIVMTKVMIFVGC